MKNILDLIDRDTFVISDHHFAHKKINKFEPSRLEKMNKLSYPNTETMFIDLWNKTVGKNDTVLYIGDFAFARVESYVKRLNGTIIFILGNHDKAIVIGGENIKGIYFEINQRLCKYETDEISLLSGLVKEIDGKKIMFCHYPLEHLNIYDQQNKRVAARVEILKEFYDSLGCKIVIHGHTHSNDNPRRDHNHINVSVERIGYKPRRIGELLKFKGFTK